MNVFVLGRVKAWGKEYLPAGDVFKNLPNTLLFRKRKEYKQIENSAGIKGKGLNVFLEHAKVKFFPGSQEKDPLLKNQPGIL